MSFPYLEVDERSVLLLFEYAVWKSFICSGDGIQVMQLCAVTFDANSSGSGLR